ncbi:MAG: type II toxin-antitoxin system HicA family toxin, partial [Rhodanobacter sp.]
MGRVPPVTHKDAVRILKNLGFTERPQKATSHTQWVKESEGHLLKVTLDEHNAPYTRKLLKSIASQAGISTPHFESPTSWDVPKARTGLTRQAFRAIYSFLMRTKSGKRTTDMGPLRNAVDIDNLGSLIQ